MIEQWWCSSCPHCKNSNWVNNGDPNDFSATDVEGIICWHCGHRWLIAEFDDFEFSEEEGNEDEPYYVNGRHFEEVKDESS